jgi:hypothetical protein
MNPLKIDVGPFLDVEISKTKNVFLSSSYRMSVYLWVSTELGK